MEMPVCKMRALLLTSLGAGPKTEVSQQRLVQLTGAVPPVLGSLGRPASLGTPTCPGYAVGVLGLGLMALNWQEPHGRGPSPERPVFPARLQDLVQPK